MATKMTLFARPSILFIFPEMQAGVRRVNPLPLTNVSCSPEDWMGATALTEALQIDPPLPRAAAVTSWPRWTRPEVLQRKPGLKRARLGALPGATLCRSPGSKQT